MKRVAPTDLNSAARPPSAIADPVSRVGDSVHGKIARGSAPAEVKAVTEELLSSGPPLSKLAEEATWHLVTTGMQATDLLTAGLIDPMRRPTGLLNFLAPASAEVEAPAQSSPARQEASPKAPMSVPELAAAGLLSVKGTTASGPSVDVSQLETGGLELGGAQSSKAGRTALSPKLGIPNAGAAGMTTGDRGGSAPANIPLPTPAPPANAVADSGGSIFVPIVALLALLALVAPTAQRRLGRAADFRLPTLFVCALERPG
ncbi:MAG TPA: hypothetical protein VFT10_05115 [Solirubrobacterales bacterium]|nr:hypothetical protein [Solirubrobacterales bacterium]